MVKYFEVPKIRGDLYSLQSYALYLYVFIVYLYTGNIWTGKILHQIVNILSNELIIITL